MAVTIKTPQFGRDTCPQAQFTVDVQSSDGGAIVYSWELKWVTHGYTVTSSQSKAYSAKIDGVTVTSGSFAIGGKTTQVIKSGTYKINRGTSSRTVPISVSFDMTFTWSGTSGGTKTASGSFTIGAKTSYTVSYDANGGSGAPSAQTKWYDTNLTLSSSTPSRTGHNFVRWNTNTSNTGTAYNPGGTYSANAGATLYAIWSAHTYTVQYNANGGTGAPGNQTKTYGTNLTLSTTKPTRPNYNFKGWSTSANGGVVYTSGATYTNNSAVTLYAVWELAYQRPRINNFNAYRCDSNGNASETGTYIRVKFNWATDRDVTSVWIDLTTHSNWSSWDGKQISASDKSGSVDQIIGDAKISIETSYYVRSAVNDSGGGTYSTVSTIGTTKFPIDVKSGGKGVAIGKVAEVENLFDIGFKTTFREGINPILISDNTDLNTITQAGFYSCPTDATAKTLVNCPATNAFSLFVENHAGSKQTLTEYMPNIYHKTYERNHYSYLDQWGEWIIKPTYTDVRNTTDTYIPVVNQGQLDYTLRKMVTGISHTDYPNNQDWLPTLSFLSYWNGSYNSSGNSNLAHCHQGTIVGERTKSIADNSGGSKSYIHLGSLKLCWGKVNITPVANTATSVYVSFPLSFARVPSIFVTPHSGAIGTQVHGAGATNMTETGFDCFLYRTNTTVTSVMWLAIGE